MGQIELTANATAGEILLFGLKISFLGIGTVFLVLIILWLILEVFRIVFEKKPEKEKNISADKITETVYADDSELVAVILAAIFASDNTVNPSNLRIVSFKRKKTPWNIL